MNSEEKNDKVVANGMNMNLFILPPSGRTHFTIVKGQSQKSVRIHLI